MKRRWISAVALVGLVVSLLAAFTLSGEVKRRVWEKQTMTANGTLTFNMSDAAVAQFTFSVASGSPDGTVTVYGRQATGGEPSLIATVGVISGTTTYICDAMGVMEVRLASHTTGSIGVEASSR